MRLFNIEPSVGFAGIKEKLPLAAFAASLARFYSFRNAHRINLSSAMNLVCSRDRKRPAGFVRIVQAVGENQSGQSFLRIVFFLEGR
jgi:hypothetical protein